MSGSNPVGNASLLKEVLGGQTAVEGLDFGEKRGVVKGFAVEPSRNQRASIGVRP